MWQSLGTLAISSVGGALFLHYLKNFLLEEKTPFAWDWDGLVERPIITLFIILGGYWLYYIPSVVLLKLVGRLLILRLPKILGKIDSQKARLRSEFAFDLIVSPIFAILIGVIF